jgi:hypothetical protein
MNSISANIDYWCSIIVERLDAPGSRTCAAHHARCPPVCLPPLTRCLRVCLLRVQRTPSADGRRQSKMHGAPLLRGRPSSLTASASWTPHTSACSDPSGTRSSGGCIPRTRRRTACSSWLSWIAGVSSATDEHSIRGSSSQQSARAHQSVCLRVSVLQDASATLTRATAPRAAQSQPRSTSRATSSCSRGCSCWATWRTRLTAASRPAGAALTSTLRASVPFSPRSAAASISASLPCASASNTRFLASSIHGSFLKPLGACPAIALLPPCAPAHCSPTISSSSATYTCNDAVIVCLERK